ncbi:MAG: hypothetical protein LBD20_03325, partial [Spirochaetaceae bacterium]|jgi:hypothetical protein|nr:hypothetical protein [Spirochaetaceae bacterium]
MYLFGGKVEKVFREYVMRSKKYDAFRKKVKKCQRIDHYSGANTSFRNVAPFQLGLTESPVPPAPPERMMLWNDSDN